jgi:hypothetical protein
MSNLVDPVRKSDTIAENENVIVEGVLYCANHPDRETLLRCNKCDKPICLQCAVQTDVGYRCKECIRGVQDKYFNVESRDYPIAFGVSLIVTAIGSPIIGLLIGGFGFFGLIIALLVGSSAGGILAQIIRRAVGKRRGRYLRQVTLAGIIAGVLVGSGLSAVFVGVFPLLSLPMLLFTGLAASTAYQLLR